MLAQVYTCAIIGLEGQVVQVEVDTGRGLPSFTLVGLPDAAVKESGERVRAAIKNSGLTMHGGRVTVNLAPADLRKAGPSYDLPIALGVLAATGQIPLESLQGALVVGELGLDGAVRHIRGVLSIAALARQQQFKHLFVPTQDAAEAALIPDVEIVPVNSLADLVNHLHGIAPIAPQIGATASSEASLAVTDLQEICGQEHVKRAMEVAAAGSHNVLWLAHPGPARRSWRAHCPASCQA